MGARPSLRVPRHRENGMTSAGEVLPVVSPAVEPSGGRRKSSFTWAVARPGAGRRPEGGAGSGRGQDSWPGEGPSLDLLPGRTAASRVGPVPACLGERRRGRTACGPGARGGLGGVVLESG